MSGFDAETGFSMTQVVLLRHRNAEGTSKMDRAGIRGYKANPRPATQGWDQRWQECGYGLL